MRPLPWLAVLAVPAAATAIAVTPPNGITEHEAATVDDIRTVVDAEARYQAVNCGYVDRLECLADPEHCVTATRATEIRLTASAAGA